MWSIKIACTRCASEEQLQSRFSNFSVNNRSYGSLLVNNVITSVKGIFKCVTNYEKTISNNVRELLL